MRNLVKFSIKIFVGIIAFFMVLGLVFRVWTLTWQSYRNDEFGFSFKYPRNWYISGYYDMKDRGGIRSVGFYVDPKQELPNSPQDPLPSPGGVQVVIEEGRSLIEAHQRQRDFSKFRRVRYGSKTGYTDEGIGRSTTALGNLFIFMKDFFVDMNGYIYNVSTGATSENDSLPAQLRARYYYFIGSSILDSFEFD